MEENEALIKLFKLYISDNKDEFKINKYALKKGIIIDDSCPSEIIDIAIRQWGTDGFLLNQTFHKSLDKVLTASMEKLIFEQLLHYFTTYGYESLGIKGEVYVPIEKLEVPKLQEGFKFVKISKITKEELKQKLWDICESGIALSKITLEGLEALYKYMNIDSNNIENIKNIEFKTRMYNKLSIVPENPINFMRFLIYSLTNSSLLIKDKQTIIDLSFSDKTKAFNLINKYKENFGLERLAEIFNRFKPLFLALKKDNIKYLIQDDDEKEEQTEDLIKINTLINKISHLSKKYHKPLIINDLDRFCKWCLKYDKENNFKELLLQKLEEAGVWRAIKLLNYLNSNNEEKAYKIRNGRVWICKKEDKKYISKKAKKIIEQFIIKRLKKNVKSKKVYLADNINLVLPQSEKQFCGNIPYSSSISFDKENILVGIHWFDTKERIDLDLKVISNDYTIGWNADYKSGNKIIFSGDMTKAPKPNGATEFIYIDKEIEKTLISLKVNNYTRYNESEFELIIAKANKENLNKNFIVDPNDIILKIPNILLEQNKAEHTLGTIIIDKDIKFVFTDLTTSNRSVSFNSEVEDILRKYTLYDSENKAKLKDFLEKSNAILVDNPNDAEIDLSINNLNKDTLISLLNK